MGRRMSMRSVKQVVVPTLIVFAACVVTCTFAPVRSFRAERSEQRVPLFDRYNLSLFGGPAERLGYVSCALRFMSAHHDTTRLDTIPILVVDSLCFSGQCLTNTFCLHPQTEGEWIAARSKEKRPNQYVGSATDLEYANGKLQPVGFIVDTAINIPDKCGRHDLRVGVKMHMIDRTTGKVLAEELKEVQFEILETKPYIHNPGVPTRLP